MIGVSGKIAVKDGQHFRFREGNGGSVAFGECFVPHSWERR
jgi:hypothetical protein